jgi:hypothetical protein
MYLSRRRTLGAGLSLIAASYLDLLRGTAQAQTAGTAKRLVIFFSPNGSPFRQGRWAPTGSENSWSFTPNSVLSPLAPHKENLVVVDGIRFFGANNHTGGQKAMLTGGGDTSVDQWIAKRLPAGPRFASLDLGVATSAYGAQQETRMLYSGGAYVSPEDSPRGAYQRLFGAALPTTPNGAANLLSRQRSILDVLKGDLDDLKTKVGAAEKAKLDEHLESLRKIEKGLQTPVGGGGEVCTKPAAPIDLPLQAHASIPGIGKAQLDLIIAALSCGLTRVASIQWTHTNCPHIFSWLGQTESHHGLSHYGNDNYVRVEQWYAEQFKYLLDGLAARQDPGGGGTLLDTSLVVWAREMGDGGNHDCDRIGFVLAGKAGGRIKTNRFLNAPNTSQQQLWVSVINAMGLSTNTFGDGAYPGPLAGL